MTMLQNKPMLIFVILSLCKERRNDLRIILYKEYFINVNDKLCHFIQISNLFF